MFSDGSLLVLVGEACSQLFHELRIYFMQDILFTVSERSRFAGIFEKLNNGKLLINWIFSWILSDLVEDEPSSDEFIDNACEWPDVIHKRFRDILVPVFKKLRRSIYMGHGLCIRQCGVAYNLRDSEIADKGSDERRIYNVLLCFFKELLYSDEKNVLRLQIHVSNLHFMQSLQAIGYPFCQMLPHPGVL